MGDAVLAVWSAAEANKEIRTQACCAALELNQAVLRFNEQPETPEFPTRIGLHGGQLFLGNIGGLDHYDYTPMGDAINTAARIETLNKQLGTWLLVSDEVLDQVEGIRARRIGEFLMVGKQHSIVLHELMAREDAASIETVEVCGMFDQALRAFAGRDWDQAEGIFRAIRERWKNDGPSQFYMNWCDEFRKNPPGPEWQGVIQLKTK